MKKILMSLFIICVTCAMLVISACGNKQKEIQLSFDSQEAYFTGSTPLYPVSGDVPASDDAVEKATISLNSDIPVRMVLSIEYSDGQSDIQGLVVSVNGAAAVDIQDNMVLYTSPEAETQSTVSLRIYLEKGSPFSNAGKTLKFSFALSALE